MTVSDSSERDFISVDPQGIEVCDIDFVHSADGFNRSSESMDLNSCLLFAKSGFTPMQGYSRNSST